MTTKQKVMLAIAVLAAVIILYFLRKWVWLNSAEYKQLQWNKTGQKIADQKADAQKIHAIEQVEVLFEPDYTTPSTQASTTQATPKQPIKINPADVPGSPANEKIKISKGIEKRLGSDFV